MCLLTGVVDQTTVHSAVKDFRKKRQDWNGSVKLVKLESRTIPVEKDTLQSSDRGYAMR